MTQNLEHNNKTSALGELEDQPTNQRIGNWEVRLTNKNKTNSNQNHYQKANVCLSLTL